MCLGSCAEPSSEHTRGVRYQAHVYAIYGEPNRVIILCAVHLPVEDVRSDVRECETTASTVSVVQAFDGLLKLPTGAL